MELGVTYRFGAEVAAVLTEAGRACGVRLARRRGAPGRHRGVRRRRAHAVPRPAPRRHRPSACTPAASGNSRRCPDSSCCSRVARPTPGSGHHTCGSRPTTTPNSTRCSAAKPAPGARPDDLRLRAERPGHAPGRRPRSMVRPRQRTAALPTPGPGHRLGRSGSRGHYRDRVLAVMAERGFDVRDRLLWSVVRTPADLERDAAAPGGSIYGTSSNGVRAAYLRPAQRRPAAGTVPRRRLRPPRRRPSARRNVRRDRR